MAEVIARAHVVDLREDQVMIRYDGGSKMVVVTAEQLGLKDCRPLGMLAKFEVFDDGTVRLQNVN